MTDTGEALSSVRDQFDLTGKICVLTGGAGFLGRQFAEAVAEMGGVPVLFDVAPSQPKEAAEAVRASHGSGDAEAVDVTDLDDLRRAAEAVKARHGRIDVLINAAGLTKYGCDADPETFFAPFEETHQDVWEAGLRINLTGVMQACQAVGPIMIEQGKGAIINIGSDVGVVSPDQRIYQPDEHGYDGVNFNVPAFYSVTKAGVIHLTRHLATEWAPHNVRVNAFSPAGVFRDHDPAFVAQLASRIPMGRMARINEYKGAIVFLASDASSFMTGHNLVMDGGRTAW